MPSLLKELIIIWKY